MLINQARMLQLVDKVVPKKYHPSANGPIRSFLLAPRRTMIKISNNLGLSMSEDAHLDGLMMDIGSITGSGAKNNHVILINEEILLEDHMIFVILHEVGHVQFRMEGSQYYSDNEELHADLYAHDVMTETVGFERSISALGRFCSRHGFGKEMRGVGEEKVRNVG